LKLRKLRVKVLLVIDHLGSGGAQNQLVLLAVELKRMGHDVSVFIYQENDFFRPVLEEANVELWYHQKKGKIGVRVVNALSSKLKIKCFDGIISFLDTPNFYALMATTISGIDTINIASYRSASNFGRISFLKSKMYQWINSAATYLVRKTAHSEKVRKILLVGKWYARICR